MHLRLSRRHPQRDRHQRHGVYGVSDPPAHRYATRVIVNFDPDTAGANAAEKSIALLTEEGFDVQRAHARRRPRSRSLRPRTRSEGLRQALRAAPTYQIGSSNEPASLFPSRDPKTKTEALNFLLPHIRRIPSRIARDAFANDAAQALGIDSGLVRAELKDAAAKRRDSIAVHNHPLNHAEQVLCSLFPRRVPAKRIWSPKAHGSSTSASSSRCAKTCETIVEILRARPDGADALTALATEEQRQVLAGIFVSIHDAEPQSDDVEAAILAIRRTALDQEQRRLRAAIDQAERAGNVDEVLRLTRENQDVTRRLRELD